MATPAKWWEADELIAPAPKATSSLLRRAVADPLVALGQGAVDLGESAVGIGSLVSGGAVGRGAQALGYDPERTREALGELYSPEAQAAFRAVEQAEGVVPTLQALAEHPSSALLYGVRSLPFMGGTVAAARGAAGLVGQGARATSAARTAAGVAEGALTAGNIAEEIRRERPGDAAAMYQGAVPAGIGTALIGRLGGALEAGLATRGMVGAAGLTGGLPARVLKGAATEAAEEAAQSAQERAWTNVALDRPWDQGVAKEAVLGGVVGGLLGGVMGPFAGGGEMAQASAPAVTSPAVAPAADIQGAAGQDTLQGGLVSAAIQDATRAPPAGEGPRVPPELLLTGRVPYRRAEEATPPPPEPIGPLTRALSLDPRARQLATGSTGPARAMTDSERSREWVLAQARWGLPRPWVEEPPTEAVTLETPATPAREELPTTGLTAGVATPEEYAAAEAALRAREQAGLPRPQIEGRMPPRGVSALEQMRQYLEGQGAPIEALTAAPPPGGLASWPELWPTGPEERIDYPIPLPDERSRTGLPSTWLASGLPARTERDRRAAPAAAVQPPPGGVQPPPVFTDREQAPKPERRRQPRQTTPTEVDWGAVERLGQQAESREALRRQGFLSTGKAQDLDAYGYRIVYWTSPKLKKAGDPNYGVIEYRPLGHGKGPQPPRLTARTAEQQAAVHQALGLPIGEAGQLALPPGKFAPRAAYAGSQAPVTPAAETGRVPATATPELATPEAAPAAPPAEAARPAPPTRKADYDELRENLRRAGEDPSGLAAWAYLQIARYAPAQGFTVQDLVRRYRSNRKSGRRNPYVSAEVPDAVLRLADRGLLSRHHDAEGNAYYTAARPFTREEEVPSDAESLRSDAGPVRGRGPEPRQGAGEGGPDLQQPGQGEGPAAGRAQGERAPEIGSPSPGPGPVVEQVQAGEKGERRFREDGRVKRWLKAKRPRDDDTPRILSYRTEAAVGGHEAAAAGADAEVLAFLRAEHDWAVERLRELAPEALVKLGYEAPSAATPATASAAPVAAAPAPVAPKKTAKQRYAERKRIDPAKDDLLSAIAKAGGIAVEEARAQGIDPAEFRRRGWGVLPVFSRSGDSFDGMAERLSQYGYLPPDYTANALLDKVDLALRGQRVVAAAGVEAQAEAALAEYEADQQAAWEAEQDAPFLLDEASYVEQHDDETRTLSDLAQEAINAGADEDAVTDLIERGALQGRADDEIARDLRDAAARAQNPDAGTGRRDLAPAGLQQGPRAGQAEAEGVTPRLQREQVDFVGGKSGQDQAIHDARLAKDAARNRDYVPPSQGPGDLFAGPRAIQQRMGLATAPPPVAPATPPTEAGPAPASPSLGPEQTRALGEEDEEILFSRRGDRIQDYRLDDYDALPAEIRSVVDRVLAEDEDPKALRERLRELKGTPWAIQALDGALARAAVREAMAGREPTWRSALDGSPLKAALQRRGEAALWDYLQSYGVLGAPAKPRLAIASSFLNCHPTRGCAEACYATGGNYQNESHILKGELIELAVRLDPQRAGRMAAQQYKAAHGLWETEALRLFDKGDGAAHWLPFVAALNRAGVRVHVFSKRPEFLRQLSEVNLRLLSVDGSRWREALAHPDLRPAFLYRGREDNDAVVALAEVARSEATLPMVLPIQRQGASTRAAMQDWRGLPQPLHRLVCPVDSGKAVRLGTGTGEYSCRRCDKGTGVGCYFHATTAEARAAVDEMMQREHAVALDPGLLELHSALKELAHEAEKHLAGDRAQHLADAVRALLADARRGALPDAAGGVAETLRGADAALGGGGGEERRGGGRAREGAAPAYGFRLTDRPGPDTVEDERGRLELYDAPSAPPRKKGQIQLATRVKHVRIGTFRSPLTKVEGVYDAVVLLRDLGLNAQEQMVALVVDANDRPLSVIRHSVGTIDGSQVYPGVLAGAIHAVRGAARVYLAHNHPSGVEDLSHADHRVSQRIAQLLWDTGVTIEGAFTVTTEGRAHDWNGARFDVSALDAAPRTGARVPVTERQYARFGALGPQVSNPETGKAAVRQIGGEASGVLLLNNRHVPIGWVPLPVGDMQKLRTGSTRSGASRLFRALSEANAAAVLLSVPAASHPEIAGIGEARRAVTNLQRFFKQADLRVLDTIYAGGTRSAAEEAVQFPDSDPYFQRGAPGPGLSVAQARAIAERLTGHLTSAPTVHVLADATDPALPPAVARRMAREGIDARAFLYQGEVYVFARELRDEADLVKTLVDHEFRHYGLRGVLGKRLTPVLEAAWRGAEHAQIRAFARDQGIDTSTARGQREAAEEYIVHLAESGQENTLLQRVFAAIREWLRRIGFDLALTDLDLRRLVAAAGTFVESGKRLPLAGLVYQSQRTMGTYEPGPAPTPPGSGAPTEMRTTPRATSPRGAAFARRPSWYYSAAGQAAAELPMRKATGAQWLAMLRKAPGVKAEELDWLGLPQWLEGQTGLPKDDLLDFIAQRQIRIEEVVKNEQLAKRQVSRYERRRRETEEALARYLRQDIALTPEQRYRTLEAVADRAQALELVASDAQVPLTDDFRRLAQAFRSAVIEAEDNAFRRRAAPRAKPRFGHGNLVVPGGTQYHELLLTLPQRYIERRFQETTPAPRGRGYRVKRAPNGHTWDLLNPTGELVERFAAREDAELLADLKNRDRHRATPFRSDHWSEPNVLVHVRFDSRTDAEGKRVLFLEEIQGDLHQTARRQGGMTAVGYRGQFRLGEPRQESGRTVYPVLGPKGEYGTYLRRADAERRVEHDNQSAVPDAPFKGSAWVLLAVKRMLRWAVDHGYDRLAWTPGALQAGRYSSLSIPFDGVRWAEWQDGTWSVILRRQGRIVHQQKDLSAAELREFLGAAVADRILAHEGLDPRPGLSQEVRVAGDFEASGIAGGQGMRAFYDRIVPQEVAKYVKRWGATVGRTDIPYPGVVPGTVRAWSLDLTDAMRESVAEGQPLFARKPKDPWTLTLAEAEWRARVLAPRVAAAYEAGDWHAAETLDAQLEALYDRLEQGYSQLEGELEEGADREQERKEGFADEEDDNLEADLASYYHSLYVAKDGRIVPTDLLYVAKPTAEQVARANAQALRGVLSDYGWKLGGLRPEVSDEEVVAAARDAYAARARRGVGQGMAARREQADARRALFRAAGARVIDDPQADLRFSRSHSDEFPGRMSSTLPSAPEPALDMRPAARVARARALGFDPDQTYYHATSYDFRAFDPAYVGLGAHVGTREHARDIGGTHVLPVWIRKASDDQIAQVTDVGDWHDFASVVESLDDDGVLTDADVAELNRLPWYSKSRLEALRQLLLNKGIRQLRYENLHEGGDEDVPETAFRQGGGESVLVLDPADLRSVFAAFDPEQAEETDLLFARASYAVYWVNPENGRTERFGPERVSRAEAERMVADLRARGWGDPGDLSHAWRGRPPGLLPWTPGAELRIWIGRPGDLERGQPPPEEPRFARQAASTGNSDLDSALAKAGIAPDARTPIQRTVDAVRDWWGATKTDLKDRILEGAFDQFHGIQTAERRVAGNLPAEQSGYVAARLSTGTSAVLYAMLHWGVPRWGRNALEPLPGSKGLLEVLAPVKDDLRGFFGWMIGRRARRLLQEGRENLFTPEEVAALEALHRPAYDRVAEDFAAYKRAVLDLAEGAGLVNPVTRAAWDHADWIPFYRLTEADRVQGPHGRKGLSHQSSGIRTLKGGTEALGDPLENLVLSFAHLVDASLKNHALRQTVTNLLAEPNGVLEPLPATEFARALVPRSEVKRILREAGADPAVLATLPPEAFDGIGQLWSLRPPKDSDVVRVMEQGKARYFRVHDPALLRGLTAVNQEALGGLVKPLRAFKRLLTAAVTADPAFMLRNFVRDALHAWTISEHAFRPGVDSVRGALKTLRESGGLRDMMFAGASFMGGYVNPGDPGEVARAIRRALRARGYDAAAEDRYLATVLDTPARFWEKYRSIGDAIENANREATFEATLRATGSTTEAAYQAKDLMDYSMRGSWTLFRLMGDVLPFFNARLQGLYKLGRAGALTRPQVLARGALIALFSLALLALNRDNDEYEALEEWDKDANWHFWLPGGRGGTQHVRLPKPFEIGLLYGTVPERVARNLLGRDDSAKSFERLLWAIRDTLAFDPVPQAVKPIAELYANRDSFTGRPIEGLADAGKRPFARYDESTSATMRALGSFTSEATGVSPKQLEHLWRGYLGALGAYALEATDIAVRWAEGGPPRAERRWDEVPVVKAFVRESPAFSTRYRTELYEMAREAEQLYRTVRALREEGRAEEAQALAEANSEKLKARPGLKRATEGMSHVRAQMDRVQRAEDMSGVEKRARLDALIGRRNEIAKGAAERAGAAF